MVYRCLEHILGRGNCWHHYEIEGAQASVPKKEVPMKTSHQMTIWKHENHEIRKAFFWSVGYRWWFLDSLAELLYTVFFFCLDVGVVFGCHRHCHKHSYTTSCVVCRPLLTIRGDHPKAKSRWPKMCHWIASLMEGPGTWQQPTATTTTTTLTTLTTTTTTSSRKQGSKHTQTWLLLFVYVYPFLRSSYHDFSRIVISKVAVLKAIVCQCWIFRGTSQRTFPRQTSGWCQF